MVRAKPKKNDGRFEGVSHTLKPKPTRRGPKKKRSLFSLEPSLITSNLSKECSRCPSLIRENEECWYYPKLPGYVHKVCSRKGSK